MGQKLANWTGLWPECCVRCSRGLGRAQLNVENRFGFGFVMSRTRLWRQCLSCYALLWPVAVTDDFNGLRTTNLHCHRGSHKSWPLL